MDTISFSYIYNVWALKYNKKNFTKNIFYIKLLVYFKDLHFIQYIDLSTYDILWVKSIIYCLIECKCPDTLIDTFIENYYFKFNLNKRLNQISDNIENINFVKRLSFYEKKKYADIYIRFGDSPTVLLVNKISCVNHLVNLSVKYNRWDCLINMYLSKYIGQDLLLAHLPKTVKYFGTDCFYDLKINGKKLHRLIETYEQIPELSNSKVFLLDLIGLIVSIYDKKFNYHFDKLSIIASNFFKTDMYNIIFSNDKLCKKIIECPGDTSVLSISQFITKLFDEKKINIISEYKTNIAKGFVSGTRKIFYSVTQETVIFLIKKFKLEAQHIQYIFANLNKHDDHLLCILKKSDFIQMKNYLIDSQGSADPDIKCEFFKYFIKYKLLTPNEIKFFILDNIQGLNYCLVKKFVKEFEPEYIQVLLANMYVSEKCLWTLSYYYKSYVSKDLIIEACVKNIIHKNEDSYVNLGIIDKMTSKEYPIKKIQELIINSLDVMTTNKKYDWCFMDLLKIYFINNKYFEPYDKLINIINSKKHLFPYGSWKELINLYKVD